MPLLMLAAALSQPGATPEQPYNPTAPYVIVGQDEPGYRSWYLAASWRGPWVRSFNDYLAAQGVAGVVPTWQLLRTASDWYKCGDQAFELPPMSEWPNLANSLRFVRDVVQPAVGPVEAVSVYRNPALNTCAGGAQESAHRYGQAMDLVPLTPTTREELMARLCAAHRQRGEPYAAGLGFYVGLRFHVDTRRFRRWGVEPSIEATCLPIPQAPQPVSPTERGLRR
ncbi:MAG TPA: D-Ala-D-Ala carboxypeptidase family metallohydrolase [Sphingomicrobium sp.]|nr:D-Ala-D-Ala carboxypeptidase family metallohydrolase [Sphingomicrobium sp.]